MPSKLATSNLWFGTDESYLAFENAQEEVSKLMAAGPEAIKVAIKAKGGGRDDDPFALPPMWEVQNGVAQVHVTGSLINGSAGFMRLFGITGYSDIAGALMEASASKDAKQIVLMVDSGGGAVNGLEDVGALIQMIDTSVKPVIAFTDGVMFSAAYWIGASARKVYGTKTSQAGSVGTLIVHTEYSKMLADDGIKKTLVRFGKFKALGNPYEPLSEDGKAELQGLADEAGKIFVDYVSDRRGMSAETFQKTAGEGRIFMGRKAKEVGLTDGVMNYNDMMTMVKTLDNAKGRNHNPRNSKDSAMKSQMSVKTIQAILAGASLEALNLSAPEANVEGVQLEADALAALTAEATALIAMVQPAVATATTTAVTAAVAPVQAALDTATAELKAATDKVALLEAGATTLSGQISASAGLAAKQSEIVKASVSVMSVAMGGAPDVGAALTGDALLAEHERLKEQFVKKFPTGCVAAVNVGLKPKPDAPKGPSAQFRSLVKPVNA